MSIIRSWILLLSFCLSRDDSFVIAFVTPEHNVLRENVSVFRNAPCFNTTITSLHATHERKLKKSRWQNPSNFLKLLRPIPLTLFTLSNVILPSRTSASTSTVSTATVSHTKTKLGTHHKSNSFDERVQQEKEHLMKCNQIEALEGLEARKAFEQKYEEKNIHRAAERKKLLYKLIGDGICPFVDVEGERQMYLFDTSQDLNHIPFSDQQTELALMKDRKWRERRRKQRYAIKCIAEDIRLQGKDPLYYLEMNQEQTKKLFDLSDRSLDVIVKRYKHLYKTQGNLSGISADQPFDVNEAINQPLLKHEEVENRNIRKAALKEISTAKKGTKRVKETNRPVFEPVSTGQSRDKSMNSNGYVKGKPPKYQVIGIAGAVAVGIYRMEMERTKKEISKMKNSLDIDESSKVIDPDDLFKEQLKEDHVHNLEDDEFLQINGNSTEDYHQQQESYILYQQWLKDNENSTDITVYKEGDSKDGEAYALYQQWVQENQTPVERIDDKITAENAFKNATSLKDAMLSQVHELDKDSQKIETRYESYALYQQWVRENDNNTNAFYKEGDPKYGEAYAIYQQWRLDNMISDEVIELGKNTTIPEKNVTEESIQLNDAMISRSDEFEEYLKQEEIISNDTNSSADAYSSLDTSAGEEVTSKTTLHKDSKVIREIHDLVSNGTDIENVNYVDDIFSHFKALSRAIENIFHGKSISAGRKGKLSSLIHYTRTQDCVTDAILFIDG